MSAQLYDFRPFHSVKKLAQQAGVNAAAVMDAIRESQLKGDPGNQIAGQFRERCWRIRNGYDPGPRGAA